MDLLLVRHAIAEDRRPDRPDAGRALTEPGRRRFLACVQGLDALGLRLDHVWHSPLLRAEQTAACLAPLLDGQAGSSELLAQPPSRALLELLGQHPDQRVALVGHEPWLGELLSVLLTGRPASAENLSFRKGGVAWLRGDPLPGAMELRALLPPRVLCALAGVR